MSERMLADCELFHTTTSFRRVWCRQMSAMGPGFQPRDSLPHPPRSVVPATRARGKLQCLHKQLERLELIVILELGLVPFSKTGA